MSPKARRPSARRDRSNTYTHLFEAIREGAFVGVLDLSLATRSVSTAANPHLKSIFGYPADTPSEQVNPFAPDRFVDPAARSAFLERLQTDGAVNDYVLRMRRADGTQAWVEVTAHAEPDGADTLRVVALVRDVSERRKLDDQSRDLYQQLLQAEKMAALGQTMSGVAHELNNPLATILSWAERLSEKSLDSTTKRGVDVPLGEADRAARIVRNLLTFARRRLSTRAMVDVNQVVTDTLGLRTYEHQLANVQVVTALASGLPQVFADAHQIQQVLLNLIVNAEQAMASANGRGSLVVRTWHDDDANTTALEVTDDGPGVPVEMRTRIFDRSSRPKTWAREPDSGSASHTPSSRSTAVRFALILILGGVRRSWWSCQSETSTRPHGRCGRRLRRWTRSVVHRYCWSRTNARLPRQSKTRCSMRDYRCTTRAMAKKRSPASGRTHTMRSSATSRCLASTE